VVFFLVLGSVVWIVTPRRRRFTTIVIRNFFFLIVGLGGYYTFSLRLLSNWLIVALMFAMMVGAIYLTEAVGKNLAGRPENTTSHK
jgi:hypothetical protein